MSQPNKNKCVVDFIVYVKIKCMTKGAHRQGEKNRSIECEVLILHMKWYRITCRLTLMS